MLFFLLLSFIFSTLKQGDNPYKILGVSSSATRAEIKKAFRELTMKLHPDKNKEKDTTAQWVEINDAFELLNDPDRKDRYDRYQSVSDEPQKETADPFSDSNERFFQKETEQFVDAKTPLLTTINFDEFVETGDECLILIYSTFMCPNCGSYLDMFESFANFYSKFCKCGRIDVAASSQLAKGIGAKGMPTFVYYKKEENKTISDCLLFQISTVHEISVFFASHWDTEIHRISTFVQFNQFMNNMDDRVRIIEIVRDKEATIQFKRLSLKQKAGFQFASIVHSEFPQFAEIYNLRTFPRYFVFRNSEIDPIQFLSTGSLVRALKTMNGCVNVELSRFNFPRSCGQSCLIRIGKAPMEEVEELKYQNFSSFWIDEKSSAAKSLDVNEGQWIYVDLQKKEYIVIKPTRNISIELEKSITGFAIQTANHKDLPSNFNVDFQMAKVVDWLKFHFGVIVSYLTFNFFDFSLTALFFGYFGYKKIHGWLEKKEQEKIINSKYKAASKVGTKRNKSAENIVKEKIKNSQTLKEGEGKGEGEEKEEGEEDKSGGKIISLDDYE